MITISPYETSIVMVLQNKNGNRVAIKNSGL
jgi:hypothetical protein